MLVKHKPRITSLLCSRLQNPVLNWNGRARQHTGQCTAYRKSDSHTETSFQGHSQRHACKVRNILTFSRNTSLEMTALFGLLQRRIYLCTHQQTQYKVPYLFPMIDNLNRAEMTQITTDKPWHDSSLHTLTWPVLWAYEHTQGNEKWCSCQHPSCWKSTRACSKNKAATT